MAEPDLFKVRRNVSRLVEQGAPEADIDRYVAEEGTTLDALRAHKSQFGSAEQRKGPSRAAVADVDKLERMGVQSGMPHRVADSASFGAFNPVMAAIGATLKSGGKVLTGGPVDWTGDYAHERDVLDEQLARARKGSGVLGTAAEMAMSLPFAGGRAKTAAAEAVGEAAAAAPGFLRRTGEMAKQGAVYSGLYGLNSARGGVSDHLDAAVTHGLTGALLGPAIGHGIVGALRVPGAVESGYKWMTGRTPERAAKVRENVAEAEAAGVTAFPPTVADRPMLDAIARSLGGSMFGGQLRAGAQRSIRDVEREAQKEIAGPLGGRPSNDVGAEVQETLRNALTKSSRSSEEVAAMTAAEKQAILGGPPRPVAEPVQPRPVDPVAPEPINPRDLKYPRVEPEPVPPPPMGAAEKVPSADQMPVPPPMAAADRQAWGAYKTAEDAFTRLHKGEVPAVPERGPALSPEQKVELYRNVFAEKGHPGAGVFSSLERARRRLELEEQNFAGLRKETPHPLRADWAGDPSQAKNVAWSNAERRVREAKGDYDAALQRAAAEADQVFGPHAATWARTYDDLMRAVEGVKASRRQVEEHQRATWERDVRGRNEAAARSTQEAYEQRVAAARKAADEQNEAARMAAQREAEQAAAQRAEQETATRRAAAAREAEEARAREQEILDREHAKGTDTLEGVRFGRSRESYPTEATAAYSLVEGKLPGDRMNPLGMAGRAERTETSTLLGQFLREGQGTLHIKGGGRSIFDETGAVRGDLIDYLRPRLGPEATGIIARLSAARAEGRGANVQGIRDMRTTVGRAIESARENGYEAAPLKRLYGALSDDLYAGIERMGHSPGFTAGGRRYEVDAAGGTSRDGRAAEATYYLKPHEAEKIYGGRVPEGGADIGLNPLQRIGVQTDRHGNKSLGVFRGEAGRESFDGRTMAGHRTKSEVGMHPIELYDGGLRARIGGPIAERAPSSGEVASQAYRNLDRHYGEHVETMRRELSSIYGKTVEPLQAMDRLVKAAADGDLNTLRAYMRVMHEKADPVRGAAAILMHATQGAGSMREFLAGYRAIPKESRGVLFAGPASALRTRLDRLEQQANKLEPYMRRIESEQHINELGRALAPSRIALGVSMFLHFPATIAGTIGSYAMSRFMASPRYLDWLTNVAKARTPADLSAHVGRLTAIADRDEVIGSDIKRVALRLKADLRKGLQ